MDHGSCRRHHHVEDTCTYTSRRLGAPRRHPHHRARRPGRVLRDRGGEPSGLSLTLPKALAELAKAAGIVAVDFLHAGTVLLRRLYALVFIEHGSRRMHIGGVSEPDGRVDRAAGPQPRPQLRRAVRGRQVPDPRPGIELHRLVRRRLPGCRHQGPAHRRPGAAHERDLRATRRHPTPRTPRPHANSRCDALRATLAEYRAHYNTARPLQGIAQRVPAGEYDSSLLTVADLGRERIYRRAVMSGLINEYSRAALHRRFAGHITNPIFERDKVGRDRLIMNDSLDQRAQL